MKIIPSIRKKNDATGNSFSRAVIALLDEDALDKVPKGWMTMPDWADATKSSETQMRRHLRVLLKAGKAKKQDFTVRSGRVRRKVSHYWVSPEFLKSAGL